MNIRLLRVVFSVFKLFKKQAWGPFVELAEITNFDHAVSVSWSQGGEDLALKWIFGDYKTGKYIDVGAHHPSRFSVTRALYQSGWSGVNVDANQELIKKFMLDRSRDLNICAAVGNETSYSLTIFKEPAISTVNLEWQEKFLRENQQIEKIIEVRGIKLRDIYSDFASEEALDLLIIDVEGADLDALRSLELENLNKNMFPKVMLLETAPPVKNAISEPAVVYAMNFGYEPVMILPMSTVLRRREG